MTNANLQPAYRVCEHLVQKTLSDNPPWVHYTIQRRTRRWFGLFGPEVWVTLSYEQMGCEFISSWDNKQEVLKECRRLNEGLPRIQTSSRVVSE